MDLQTTINQINIVLASEFPDNSPKVRVECCKIYIGDRQIGAVSGFVLPRDVIDAVRLWIDTMTAKFRLVISGLQRISVQEAATATILRINPNNPLKYK